MKTENAALMKMARESLVGNWPISVGATALYVFITTALQQIPKSGLVIGLIISGPMFLGFVIFFLMISRGQSPRINHLFDGFKEIGVAIGAYLLMCVFVVLWGLLLIVPGIIASLSYSMTFYIIADDRTIGSLDAIKKSKRMMDGYKWKLFCLHLRFLGWAILCILTAGIGFLWLLPYIQVAQSKFYEDIKNRVEPVVVVT